jgi:hypothetical protein
MKIKFNTGVSGAFSANKGDVLDIEHEEAKRLVAAGYAESLEPDDADGDTEEAPAKVEKPKRGKKQTAEQSAEAGE